MMVGEIDPKLLEQIECAEAEGEVEAVILVARPKTMASRGSADERGPAGEVLDRAVAETREKPASVRFLPRLGAMVVKGSARLVRRLIQDPNVVTATTNDGEITPNR